MKNREEKKKQKERGALGLFAQTSCYKELIPFGPEIFEDSERPDFVAVHEGKKFGIEVLRIQTPKQAVFEQECPPNFLQLNPDGSIVEETFVFQDVTPTLLNKKVKAKDWDDIRSGKQLQTTSLVSPTFVSAAEVEIGYWTLATAGILGKGEKVAGYAACDLQLLLVEDCLSDSGEFEERKKTLEVWLAKQPKRLKFDAIVLLHRMDAIAYRVQ